MGGLDRRGFTLLELMIVVAIISMLAAFSVSNVARSRTQAREAQVIEFLRQYHIAQIQFQTAGIKDANGDGVGDFGTLKDLLNAGIYAQLVMPPATGAERIELAIGRSALLEWLIPAAHAAPVAAASEAASRTNASAVSVTNSRRVRDTKPGLDTGRIVDGTGGGTGKVPLSTGPAFLQGINSSLLNSGVLYGYRFQFTTVVQKGQDPGWYEVSCRPANAASGGRGFYIDATGTIRQSTDGSFANAKSKPL